MARAIAKQDASAASSAPPDLSFELYREVFAHSKEAIAIIDPKGQYLDQNAAHYELLGYSDSELHGRTPGIHMGRQTFERVLKELSEKGEYRGAVTSRTRSGEAKQIELTAFVIKNGSAEAICYVGIEPDVTESRKSEDALQRREAELADFFETAATGLHWAGPDGRIVRVSQAELDLLGYSREEYLGHHISEFYLDQDVSQDILKRLHNGEVIREQEARLRCRDGLIKYVSINSSAYWENGEFVHSRCFTRDITERKRTEQRLSLQYAVTRIISESTELVKSAYEILQTVCENLDWDIGVLWSLHRDSERLSFVEIWHAKDLDVSEFEAVCRNANFERGTGLPGRIWDTAMPIWIPNVLEDNNFPRAPVAARTGLHSAFGFPILVGGEVIGAIEFFNREIRQPDQGLLTMMASIGGQIGQFQERKRAEAELATLLVRERAARSEAEQANRLKDEFLATVSHELRTPLNAVMGWARMLRLGRLDEESSSHALEVIERNAWAQKQIIEDILDVSRVITGKLQLNVSPVNPAAVVEAALDAVRPALEAKQIRIRANIEPGIRPISGDSDRLQQVVWNLLSNATKFTPAGGEVTLDVKQTKSVIQIQVLDTGPGIEPGFLPYVFERFRQADGSTTRTHGGLGLGLAIVRHLVELHGGSIKGENRSDGHGAIFTVNLPLPSGPLRLEDVPATFPREDDTSASAPDLSGLRILVIEDEADALDLLTVQLTECGARVNAYLSAEEGLKALEKTDFDLLISDIGMPDQDGYQFIRKVRAREASSARRKVPAVALTGHARVQDRMRALIAGYDTHVAKPIETSELLTVAASLVGRLVK